MDSVDWKAITRGRLATGKTMTNFDHSIDDGLEDDLRAGQVGEHAAWNFYGQVWFDPDAGLFYELVRRFHSPIALHAAPSLQDLMHEVNDEHGWD